MPFFQKPPIQFRVKLPQAFRFFTKCHIGHFVKMSDVFFRFYDSASDFAENWGRIVH